MTKQLSLICCKGTWLIIERRTIKEGDSNKGNSVTGIGKFHTSDEITVCDLSLASWLITCSYFCDRDSLLYSLAIGMVKTGFNRFTGYKNLIDANIFEYAV